MSARRLGRLLGTTLALVAFAALLGGTLDAGAGTGSGGTMHTDDFDWAARTTAAVIDFHAGTGGFVASEA
jgi:hypothetical protein